jgi:hypothetical protein
MNNITNYEKYVKKYLPEIEEWARAGMTARDMIKRLKICRSTFYDWQKRYPEFREAFDTGRDAQLDDIEACAYKAAKGHVIKEIWLDENGDISKQFHKELPPNQKSIEYILNNRRPETWKSDTSRIDISISEKIKDKFEKLDTTELVALANMQFTENDIETKEE